MVGTGCPPYRAKIRSSSDRPPNKMILNLKLGITILPMVFAAAAHANTVSVFGLPLGGKLSPRPEVCVDLSKITRACWFGPAKQDPELRTQERSLILPSSQLPSWAGELVRATIDEKGILRTISVGNQSCNIGEVLHSIRSRFGEPSMDRLADYDKGQPGGALWVLPNIKIMLVQSKEAGDRDKTCTVQFNAKPKAKPGEGKVERDSRSSSVRPTTP
jgi:hypothetical protein